MTLSDDETQAIELTRAMIEAAWSEMPYPGDDISGCPCSDCKQYELHFRGKHWRDILRDMLEYLKAGNTYHSSGIHALTPAAFRYYLPAYLIASLDDDADVVADSTIYLLTPPDELPHKLLRAREPLNRSQDNDRFNANIEGLTQQQCRAIASFFGADSGISASNAEADDLLFPSYVSYLAAMEFWKGKADASEFS